MSSCVLCIFKYIVFLFNYILLLIGVSLLLINIWLKGPSEYYENFVSGEANTAQIVLASFCVGVILVSFCGCFGSLKENRCLIILYGISMFLLLVTEVIGFGYGYWNRANLELAAKREMMKVFDDYYIDTSSKNEAIHMVDYLQSKLRCCGFESIDDWKGLQPDKELTQVPMSCCSNIRVKDYKICTASDAYSDGCWKKMLEKGKLLYTDFQIGVAVIILIELFALIFSICFSKAQAKKSQKYSEDSVTNFY